MRYVGLRRLGALLAMLLLATSLLIPPAALAQKNEEIVPYLPAGARITQLFSDVDTDGDGSADIVALYQLQPTRGSNPEANIAVLRGPAGARAAHHLFGEPGKAFRAPTLAAGAAAQLDVRDINADGLPEISLRLRQSDATPGELLWVFRWDGRVYRAEALLEGLQIEILSSDPEPGLRTRGRARRWYYEGAPTVAFEEVYRWRDGGYRLTERSIRFPAELPPPTHPEVAVLRFYQLIGHGDLRGAYDLLGPTFQAQHPYDEWAAGYAGTRDVIVEEVRSYRTHWDLRNDPPLDSPVYVRLTAVDEARPAPRARSFAGTWRVGRHGDTWRLEQASIGSAPSLAAIADALPPGRIIVQTAQGDLRGTGQDDLAVVTRPPDRYAPVEPIVLLGQDRGYQPVNLEDVVADYGIGGPGGDVSIEDVTGDGRPELVYGGVVGAHSSVLWVLGWDGRALVPRFEGFSNSPGLGLNDLDRDGLPEILMAQSGYCGSYAGSPQIAFAFRWRDGAYRPASAEFPDLQGDHFFEHAQRALADAEGRAEEPRREAVACIHHMVATGHALAGRAAEVRAAYRSYQLARGTITGDLQRLSIFPSFLGGPFFEDQMRDVLERAEAGRLHGWGPSELALLHDLIGNSHEVRWESSRYRAESAAQSANQTDVEAARRESAEARTAAERAYRAALALDPADPEAQAGLVRLSQ